MAMVIGSTASIYVIRSVLDKEGDDIRKNSPTIASILNAVQIQIFNVIYHFAAVRLTESENHRTNTKFEDSMITKLFLFQFVNSYASFFFIAFVAKYLAPPPQAAGEEPSIPALHFIRKLITENFHLRSQHHRAVWQ